ncbi:helix-turn-helix domain-containing protein [Aquibacillus sp. 3ASR75-11]|uniref:Helix-turn-helix domain-containing protein n=1 Tax=Terrihalobacillus insolitus TaxID=2950438 RepID=A0A9X3WQW2_9BACI|nr:helix-turn-helix domain-containing protein [Terrihalobacillus insolitus]MDC3424232.1 helix-turn-helix domain-containing protein [Terrihalobacillus insolitus]
MSINGKYLTTKQVAEELNVSVPTIYKYVKEKKLRPVYEDKWQIDETLLFRPEDVEQVKESLTKPGLTTGEVAKELGVHPTTVASYINQGILSATKQLYMGRELYFISEAELESFKEHNTFQKNREKKQFFTKDKKYFLFQRMQNKEESILGRIMDLDGDKGKVVTEEGRTIPLSNLENEGFTRVETFKEKKYITKRGYAYFQFHLPNHISSPIFDIIEMFYREIGFKNIRLTVNDGIMDLEVKPVLLSSIVESTNPHEIKILKDHIKRGTVSVRHNGVLIDSEIEPLVVPIPTKLKEDLKDAADKQGITLEKYVLGLLQEKMYQYKIGEE